MTIFQVGSFVQIYVNIKQFLRENILQGVQILATVILDCFPCFRFVFKVLLTFFQLNKAYTPFKHKINTKNKSNTVCFHEEIPF